MGSGKTVALVALAGGSIASSPDSGEASTPHSQHSEINREVENNPHPGVFSRDVVDELYTVVETTPSDPKHTQSSESSSAKQPISYNLSTD